VEEFLVGKILITVTH